MGDTCQGGFDDPNLYTALADAGLSFAGYLEDLPSPGFMGCDWEHYSKTHNPVAFFDDVPDEANLPFASYFPDDYRNLPTVSFVVPNLLDDMHSASTLDGDEWLRMNIDPYVKWAQSNNSLLVLTWDEGENDPRDDNHIATVLVGPMVQPGEYKESINHYNVLRTVEDMYGLTYLGSSGDASPITDVWIGGHAPQSLGTGLLTSAPPTIPIRIQVESSCSLVAVERSSYGIALRTDDYRPRKEAATQLFRDKAPALQTVAGATVLQDAADIDDSATVRGSDSADRALEHQQ
jgi:hypothetical protein